MDLNNFYSENISINHSTLFNNSRNLMFLPFYQHSLAVASVIILAYVLIFSLCMLGNILVCFIVLRNRQMRTVTNIFILNLAISDLLVGILCLPITLVDNLITGWPFDVLICKMSGLVQGASVSASVFTLVAIAVERLITLPLLFLIYRFDFNNCDILCLLLFDHFNLVILFTFFNIIMICCHLIFSRISIFWHNFDFSIPEFSPFINNCGIPPVFRRKLRVVNMLLMVALLFAVSWLPLWILMMLTDYGNLSAAQLDLVAVYVFPFAHWLAFFNSSVNPIVYGYFNENFRRGFQAAFKLGLCVVDKPPQPRRNAAWKHNRVFADRDETNAKSENAYLAICHVTFACMHTCIHTQKHTHTRMHTQTHTYTHTHKHAHVHKHILTHTQTYKYIHKHTLTVGLHGLGKTYKHKKMFLLLLLEYENSILKTKIA
uniref:Neuropeptide FF receptor 1 n=1 Tax=Sinocyclocheilus rhinocerous TaxID=307959 RepID=A0A673MW74_9TELE